MKFIALLLGLALFGGASAQDQPTAESVRRLLVVSKAPALMDSMYAGIEASVRQSLSASYDRQPLTAAQRQALDRIPGRFIEVFRSEFNWDRMEPDYIRLYQQTFSQEEVDALVNLYDSPLGRTLTDKMPALVQRSMSLGQERAVALLPRVKAVIDQSLRDAGLTP